MSEPSSLLSPTSTQLNFEVSTSLLHSDSWDPKQFSVLVGLIRTKEEKGYTASLLWGLDLEVPLDQFRWALQESAEDALNEEFGWQFRIEQETRRNTILIRALARAPHEQGIRAFEAVILLETKVLGMEHVIICNGSAGTFTPLLYDVLIETIPNFQINLPLPKGILAALGYLMFPIDHCLSSIHRSPLSF